MTGAARRAAVLGHPIAHSLSPVLHRAAYAALGLDGWRYDAIDTPLERLPEVVAAVDQQWAGLSVTMPLKTAILAHLHHVEPLAELLGVVNTVLVQPGEPVSLVGANTDVAGILAALRESQRPLDGPAVVVGGGATAASALAALAQVGQTEATVQVRSPARAGATVRAAHRMGLAPRVAALGTAERAVASWREAGIVVVTLPPGAGDAFADALRDAGAEAGGVLLDCAYDPRPTPLGRAWGDRGGTVVPGERMLLHQAAEQVRLMTGHPAPLDAMDRALHAALGTASKEPGGR
ncbi:shikimate dehydrogenase [Isoptericola sp. b441]|uniref:Shikimate dehydrogenase n=2 Tax=Actinotalea lenta TaxID=3064654 RepID=A0ABT9DB54_9CELL|nr:shikimate dehydrogenase [Isoptericola sp. b441]MDO8107800.1 shikimate dehydrogenase [Isoptericola sp. b441]